MNARRDEVRRNLGEVIARIADAATRAGRSAGDIKLVGVSKYVDAAEAALLVDAGCNTLGESRPQQLRAKAAAPELAGRDIQWHMIGHLQRNKVDQTLQIASLLHSIDSTRLLAAIDKSAEKQSLAVAGLLEVNCSGDQAKHGFAPNDVAEVLDTLSSYPHVRIVGLMTMAAREGGKEAARRNFAELRELRDRLARNAPEGAELRELSMGMSGDFEEAIAQGATIVRVGSALWK